MSFFRPTVDTLSPYVPGLQPAAGVPVVKLNTNENPYPASPRALEALRQLDPQRLRCYPDPLADEFRQTVATVLNLDPSWVLVGNGSDDLLTMVVRAAAGPDLPVVYPSPTYVLYRTLAEIQDAPVVAVPFDDQFALPVNELVNASGAVTFVANPNSPSGTKATNTQLARLANSLDGLLVIDEAYVAFADDDALALVAEHPNVIVLRTLSKSHGLAGLRLGFAIAQPPIIEGLAKVKDSYNVDAVAAHVGAVALRDTVYTAEVIERIKNDRAQLATALQEFGCHVWPSQANFLLVRPPQADAERVHRDLETQGVLVRYFDDPALATTLRITIGTSDQHAVLLDSLRTILGGDPAATTGNRA